MPAILALLLFISQAVLSCPTTELQVHSSRQDAKSSVFLMHISAEAGNNYEFDRSFQSRSIAHWDAPLQTFSILITIVLILVILGWIIRDRCCIHHAGLNQDDAAPESESSSLLGTRVSSSTTLHDNYQSYRSIATTAVHTPNHSPRGRAKLILQNVHATYSESILGGYGDYVTSPMESIPCLFEPPKIVVQAPDSVTRGRTSAVTQKAKSISSNHFDPAMDESQVHESEDCQSSKASKKRAQSQHGPPSITTPVPANETRAQTAPCIKIRSASLAKSLTGLVSLQQAMVHVLAVGMSWEGIAGGSRVLPGPHHDIEWLRNLFSFQKNFRFSSLLDHAATLTAIRQSLENMLSVASEDDPLVLYFSGHGGQGDSFELYGSILLTEVMLNEWIVQFRSTALRNSPVYIIFDFCRPDRVKPNTELASGVNVIWACSPTESALDLRLKDPKNHLPRSCFLLSLILAIDDVSEDPRASVVQRFATRMKELVQLIRGVRCYHAKCRLPWRYCTCDACSDNKLCVHDMHAGELPFQVVCVGGIEKNSNLPAVVKYIADRFPLHIKRTAHRVSNYYWILYFNPSHISANRQPLNTRNHRLGTDIEVEANTARNMTVPPHLIRL